MRDKHPLAGKTVILKLKGDPKHRDIPIDGQEYRVEDWWSNVSGKP